MKQFVFYILWTLFLSTESFTTNFSTNDSKHFSTIVFPKQLNEKLKFENKVHTIIDAKINAHLHQVSFLMEFNSTKLILDLNLNKELIPAHFTSSIHSQEGFSEVQLSEKDFHHCHYYGDVRGVVGSHVRVSTCQGLRGYIALKDDYFLIEPLQGDKKGAHILYRSEAKVLGSCEAEEFAQNNLTTNENNEILHSRKKRDVLSQRLFIELLIVVDANMYKRFETRESLEEHVKSVINYIDGYYTELNIRVVLTHLEVWKINKIQFSNNGRTALDQFTKYRKQKLINDPVDSPWRRADGSQALIGLDFVGITVGVAHLKAMCSITSAGVNQDLGSPASVAPILAHELGHNLGMSHDTNQCPCKEGYDCLMAPMVGSRSKKSWTECSREYLESYLKLGIGNCLMNVPDPKTLYGGPHCGNEIIEKGEECDCGYPDECTSKCCNATTCKLLPEAQCDIGDCCSSCKFIAMGTECRKTEGSCDLPEFCTGASPFCPGNAYIEDGVDCNDGKDACYDGVCLTRDIQCQVIWGKDSYSGPDICYEEVNRRGNRNGNCGFNDQGAFIKCQQQDATCGKLHCITKTDYPILRALRRRVSYANTYLNFECKTVGSQLNIGESQDFDESGLVQEGSRCGKNKSCKNNKCVTTSLSCSEKCNGKGVCNNKFHCHCDVGYAPPFCKAQGRGGSIDSGPASQESNFEVILISCLFGLVLPAILFALAFIWYKFCKGKDQITEWKKNRKIRKKNIEEFTEEQERLTAVNEMKRMNKVGESFTSSIDSFDSRKNLRIDDSNLNQTNQYVKVSARPPTKPIMKNSPRPTRPPPKVPPPKVPPTKVSPPKVPSPQVLTSEFPPPPPYAVSQNFPPLPSAANKPKSSQNLFVSQPPPLPPVATKPKTFHNSRLQGSQTPPLLPPSFAKPSPIQMRKATSKPSTPIRRTPIKDLKPGNKPNEQSLDDTSVTFSVSELKQRFNMQ